MELTLSFSFLTLTLLRFVTDLAGGSSLGSGSAGGLMSSGVRGSLCKGSVELS